MSTLRDNLDMAAEFTNEFSQFYNSSDDELSFTELNPIYSEVDSNEQRYTSFEEIGRGGMKIISRVYDNKSGRNVAFAQLYPDASNDYYESFLREARLTAGLQHPNIIPVYDVGIVDTMPFFTMELKGGKSLRELVIGSKLSVDRSIDENSKDSSHAQNPSRTKDKEQKSLDGINSFLEIFVKICDAIAYAHSRSVVHLDLKPENIQIGEYGEVMVCDWGLGKVLGAPDEDDTGLYFNPDLLNNMTLAGDIKGTPGYMAPEQIERDGQKNFQTDIYALGAVLYTLLTLHSPADGEVKSILNTTKSGKLFNFDTTSHVPKSLKAVVQKATAVEQADRYTSVTELRNDVYQYLAGFPSSAENAHFLKQLLLLFKRNRRVTIILFSALVTFFALTLYSVNKIKKSEQAARGALIAAEKERDNAHKALKKYTKEKRYSTKLAKSFEQAVFGQSLLFRSSGIYSNRTTQDDYLRVIRELDKVLKKKPRDKVAIYDKGKLLLIMQRFKEAADCYRINPAHGEVTIDLVEEYAAKYPGNQLKDVDVIVEFIRQVKQRYIAGRRPLTEKMMTYDSLMRKNLNEHSKIVREVIKVYNRYWDNEEFTYNSADRSLTIGGYHLYRFLPEPDNSHSSHFNLLRTLKIDSLTINSKQFKNLENVSCLQLSSLDISNTQVSTVPQPHFLELISEIICRSGQFSDIERAKFPSHIKITEK